MNAIDDIPNMPKCLAQSLVHNGRLNIDSFSSHSQRSLTPRLSPTCLVYFYSAFTLLLLFNLFITGLTEEQRKYQDQTHQIGNFCFSFFPCSSSHKNTPPLDMQCSSSPQQYMVCTVCSIFTITRSNVPMPLVFTLTSKYFNNKCHQVHL